ncbi:MAG: two-component regulator propeller domain-containing protein [Bacteroidota bacterium]
MIFKHLNRGNGLPAELVTCVTQDSMGFMWVGTSEGLYKYDGYTYKTFDGDDLHVKNLLNNHIADLYVDRSGFIWVTVQYSGVVVLNSAGQFVAIFNGQTNPSFPGSRAHRVKEDDAGNIWCATDDGLFMLQPELQKIKVLQKIDLKKSGHTTNLMGDFLFDTKGRIWICTYKGLVVYNIASGRVHNYYNNPDKLVLLDDTIASQSVFLEEKKGKIWYSNWAPGLKIYDAVNKSATIIYNGAGSLKPDYGWLAVCFFYDSHKRLWVATGKGLFLAEESLQNIQLNYAHDPQNSSGICDNSVNDIYEDKDGNFWVATYNGISIANPYEERFTNFSGDFLSQFGFAGHQVSDIIVADTNTLLVCTYGADGIYETDYQFRQKRHFSFNDNGYDWVWSYYKDSKNNQVYISTKKGMLLYNIATHSIKKLTAPPFDSFYPVNAFIPDSDRSLWMCGYRNEFIQYNPLNGHFNRYNITNMGLPPQIISLAPGGASQLWIIANASGLLRFDKTSKTIVEKIPARVGHPNSLQQTEVICFKDFGGYYLLGYDQKGFSIYDKQTKNFDHYNRVNGLGSNRVSDALLHPDGNIWIATSNGLSSFNPATKEIVTYNYDQGILNSDLACLTLLPNNKIAAGTSKGLFVFDPYQLKSRSMPAAPFVTDVSVYGKRLVADSFSKPGSFLEVPYQENYFSLNYIALQYGQQYQVEYAYMLEGFDKAWIPAGNRRFVSYSNLNGGNYAFRVKARLPGNEWVESKYALHLLVTTPFYKKWWFILIAVLLLGTLLFAVFQYRLLQLLRLEKMRSSISSDLHDEVGATLSSISIFSEMAKQVLPAGNKAEAYLNRIGERSRDSIDKMSDIIWSINPENDSLQEILIRMKTFATEMAEGKDILIQWEEASQMAGLKLGMLQRKNLYLLFKEAMTNAIKYADASNIIVQLYCHNKMVSLTIADDGIGFNMDDPKRGNGIKNMRQRALSLHGTVAIQSAPGKGTTVKVAFSI